MCDFNFKDNCFHPKRVGRGLIADKCNVHNCTYCTNHQWQKDRIKAELQHYQNIIQITNIPPAFPTEETNHAITEPISTEKRWTKIFGLF